MVGMVAPLFIQAVAVFLATAFAAEIEPIAWVKALTQTALATRPEVTVRGTVIPSRARRCRCGRRGAGEDGEQYAGRDAAAVGVR